MKGMKKILMVLMVLSMVVVFTGQAMGAYVWWTCDVVSAGYNQDQGRVEIDLIRENAANSKTFSATPGGTEGYTDAEVNRILAVALSALSGQVKVKAYIDWPASSPGNPSELRGIMLLTTP